MNQVGEQGDTAADDKDPELGDSRQAQDCEREADGAQSRLRALDAVVYEAVRMAVGFVTAFVVVVSAVRMSVRT